MALPSERPPFHRGGRVVCTARSRHWLEPWHSIPTPEARVGGRRHVGVDTFPRLR